MAATAAPDPARRAVPAVVVTGQLDAADVERVTALCRAATSVDGVSPISEHVALHLRYGGEGTDRNLLLWAPATGGKGGPGSLLAGYAHLDPTDEVVGAVAEVVVHPDHRRSGYGRMLVRAAMQAAPDARLRLWAHGDHPGARALARSIGYQEVRQLWQMRRSLWAPLPEVGLPAGVRVRAFRPGLDDHEWLALNARAFAGHPEQSGWTARDLRVRLKESWFDPEGFLVAEEDARAGQDGARLVAFHWTKIHGHAHPHGRSHGHEPIGEVYVVGVDPDQQGRGLGRAMTVAGLRRLRDQGLAQAMLYVDADNTAAVRVYESLGFSHWDTDVMFRQPAAR